MAAAVLTAQHHDSRLPKSTERPKSVNACLEAAISLPKSNFTSQSHEREASAVTGLDDD
jgi:hypothetical protein